MRFEPDAAPQRLELQLQALWAGVALAVAFVVLIVACVAARAVEAVAASSLEAARLTGETAVRASEAAGARAAAVLAAAMGEPARRSAQAAERLADSVHDFKCVLASCAAASPGGHGRRLADDMSYVRVVMLRCCEPM